MTKIVVKKSNESENQDNNEQEEEDQREVKEEKNVEDDAQGKKVETEKQMKETITEEKEIKIKKEVRPRNEKSDFIYTNVKGFDDLLDKGVPRGSQILISGGPGTLKTTFSMQVAVEIASRDMKALYLSFEEPKKNLLRNLYSYDWDILDLIKSGNLVIRKMDPFSMSRSVETLLAQARGELMIEVNEAKNLIPDGMNPDLIVVDSLSAISAGFFGKEEGYRAYISQIFETFRKLSITTLLITEIEHSTTRYSKTGVEEFLADGVFVFYNIRKGNQRVNATEIVKLRGSKHKKKIVPFKVVDKKGIVVYPNEEIFISE